MNLPTYILHDAKIYRNHNCDRSHKEYRTAAKCIWHWAASITGEGPYAIRHRARGITYGSTWTIELYQPDAIERAMASMRDMHYGGPCSGTCSNYYDLFFLAPTVLEAGHKWEVR